MLGLALSLALLAADTAPAATGRIAGKITLAGLPPKLANQPVTRDIKICGTSKPDESLEVGSGGGVKNAVLWLPEGPPPGNDVAHQTVKLDQQACSYVPHVVAAPVGTTLDVVNSDSALHNVRAMVREGKAFNYAMPIKGHVVPTRLRTIGTMKIVCDVHPWMHAVVHVLPTAAFATTDADGSYAIEGVPPGKYKLKLSHEKLGEREEEIEVKAGQTTQHDVSLTPR
jgi:plastocyanin